MAYFLGIFHLRNLSALCLSFASKAAPKERKNIGRGERSVTPANHAPITILAPKGRKNNNAQLKSIFRPFGAKVSGLYVMQWFRFATPLPVVFRPFRAYFLYVPTCET